MENLQEEIENKIIDWTISGAGGRLVVFKPPDPSGGADLVVVQKGEYDPAGNKDLPKSIIVKTKIFGDSSQKESTEIFISVNGLLKESDSSIFKKDVDIEAFKKTKNFYLAFVFFNILKQDIEDFICFVPLQEFTKIAGKVNNGNVFKFESFLSADKNDKYSKFFVNKKDFAQILFNKISQV